MTLPKPGFIPTARVIVESDSEQAEVDTQFERASASNRDAQPSDQVRELHPWFQTLNELPPPPFDWPALFGNPHPVEVEIGSARGLFLYNAGRTQPDRNFLGIENDLKEAIRGAARLQRYQISNARMLGADAKLVFARYLPSGSVEGVHIYFPDPWWKRKHHRRRLFTRSFLDQVARVLPPGGLFHAWTDVGDYFAMMVEIVGQHPLFSRLPDPPEKTPRDDLDYRTSFERKKRRAGLPIHRGLWQRVGPPAPPLVPTDEPASRPAEEVVDAPAGSVVPDPLPPGSPQSEEAQRCGS